MALIKIKPDRRTKIADGSCTVLAKYNTHIIHITDEDKNLLSSTYANNLQTINTDKAVYAEASKYEMEIDVIETNPKKIEEPVSKKKKTTNKSKNKE